MTSQKPLVIMAIWLLNIDKEQIIKTKNMKKSIISGLAILLMTTTAFAGKDKSTLKEKIDRAEKISYYLVMEDVVHKPKKSSTGKSCAKFTEKTVFPLTFQAEASNIIDLFSAEMGISSIVAEDINNVPIKTFSGKSMYDYSKGGRKEGDLVIVLAFSGTYNAHKGNNSSPDADWNTMTLTATVTLLEVISGGRTKTLKTTTIALVNATMVESKTCADYTFFKTNFPLENYKEDFKKSYEQKLPKLTGKIIKKHNKAVSKRK